MAYRRSTAEQSTLMEPGRRDRPVLIQQRPTADAKDSAGAPSDGPWTTLASLVWMSKEDVSLDERFTANQESAYADSRWEMPYRADMDPDLVDVAKVRRLVYLGRTFDVVAGSVIGRREGIELFTLAKTG